MLAAKGVAVPVVLTAAFPADEDDGMATLPRQVARACSRCGREQ